MIRALATAAIIAVATMHPAGDGVSVPLWAQHPSCPYRVTEDSAGPYPCGWEPWMGNGITGRHLFRLGGWAL